MKSTRRESADQSATSSKQSNRSRTSENNKPSSTRSRQAFDGERQKPTTTPTATDKRGERGTSAAESLKQRSIGGSRTKSCGTKNATNNVIDSHQPSSRAMEQRHRPASLVTRTMQQTAAAAAAVADKQSLTRKRRHVFNETSRDRSADSSSSSQEMTATSASSLPSDVTLTPMPGGNIVLEQETNLDRLEGAGSGAGDDTDYDECTTLLEESPKSAPDAQRQHKTTTLNDLSAHKGRAGGSHKPEIVSYHDDEEINCSDRQTSLVSGAPALKLQQAKRPSLDEEDNYDEEVFNDLSKGAALTMADDDQLTTTHSEEISFVVYPLGCCEFDETQLVASTSTRAIQKCILRLSNKPSREEAMCWGLDQSQPVLMRLLEDHIQFTDITSQGLLRSLPTQAIRSWAVDDDNNFAFVVEENQRNQTSHDVAELIDYVLLNGPTFMCYVFRSLDDDDMSCRIAAKLNEEITRYREHSSSRVSKSSRLQPMTVVDLHQAPTLNDQQMDLDAGDLDELEQLETASELSMNVKYIGRVQVPRPTGIDVLNVAIDKCLADASNRSIAGSSNEPAHSISAAGSPLITAKLIVSPSSVIVENLETGAIIVECRIRYLTFMGISRRDIRWCGFIMQNTTNKTFVAHCFECHPTAGHVCEAIQASCSKMYEKMLRGQKTKKQQQQDATTSIMPNGSKIRDTLAKTLSRIKLTPII